MMDAFRVALQSIRWINQRGYQAVWGNILWFVLTLPVVTAPAAWAALVWMQRQAIIQPSSTTEYFWEAFKLHFKRSLVVLGLSVVIVGINLTNLLVYATDSSLQGAVLRAIWVLVLAAWFTVQFYLWPLLYEMEKPDLWTAFRNAALMLLLNPGFTMGLWLVIGVLAVISTVLTAAWFVLTGSFLAILANVAVMNRLAKAGLREPLKVPEASVGDDYDVNVT
jgi:uncharacterized membrane protein YesL